ncbi:MAG: protein translocase subunit SecF [Eubacteriales bacterium]
MAENLQAPAKGVASYDQVKKEHKLYFNIVERRKLWYSISLTVILAGLISLFAQGLNFGIDFTGGDMIDIKFDTVVKQADISKALESVDLKGSVQLSAGDTEAIIRTEVLEETKRDELLKTIQEDVATYDTKMLKEDKVGPSIGVELRNDAFKALAVATVLMLIYISFRFKFIYAVTGIIALLHDVFITIGVFSILQWQIDASFVAAILTVFGYSINDTVVIFDRIRENEKRMKKRDSFKEMIDKSVWQTMHRSVNTTVTVLIALFAIFIFGGVSTKVFAFAMLIGVFSGAYSSIFIASQLIVTIKGKLGEISK